MYESASNISEMQPYARNLNQTVSQLKEKLKIRKTVIQPYSFRPQIHSIPKGWSTLPYVILQIIFEKIDNEYLIRYITLVCKHWRRAIMHDKFIKHLSLTHDETPLHYVYDFLRNFKYLHSLNLINVPNPLHILMQAHKLCKNLKKISMKEYPHIDTKVIKYITKSFPRLEALNMESSNIDTINLSSEITTFTRLKSLNLYNVKTINLNTNTIIEIVLNARDLEELNIGLFPPLINLKDDDVLLIITNLASKLTSLTLDSRMLTMRSLEKLRDCKNLRRLYIKYAVNLTGEFLLEFWKNLWNLEELGFTHNCIINGHDLQSLFTKGQHVFTDITHLDFTYCVLISDVGIEAIANVCTKLKKIGLKSCRSITTIEPLCSTCKNLRYIDISFCTALKMNFCIPKYLDTLIVDERKNVLYYIERFKHLKFLRIYIAVSEFSEELERIRD